MTNPPFRSHYSESIARSKGYLHEPDCETWADLANTLAVVVCGGFLPPSTITAIRDAIAEMKFIPAGRYLYYAGRPTKFYNNCYIFISQEDTREDWADLAYKTTSCLMTGGGIGNDYSVYRAHGSPLARSGGIASGPVSAMEMINEIGRRVRQGGSRRSAIYASLARTHPDIIHFLKIKDWDNMTIPGSNITYGDAKKADFDFPCPLDSTNISVNYSDDWLALDDPSKDPVFMLNCTLACSNGEPGFSFNFGEKRNETGRNACTEITSADDSDVCNLGSINLSRIETIDELRAITEVAVAFLLCGTLCADVPYQKIKDVRKKNRRLGLGLMGVHEWLLKRGCRYEVTPELHQWLAAYRDVSTQSAKSHADLLSVSTPIAVRAIAPTGTISMVAGTTSGIEPIYAPAYKRRVYLGNKHSFEYVIDPTAQVIHEQYDIPLDNIECASDLAADPERRIKFQADVQDYVDQGISSTLNLPEWGSPQNNPDTVEQFAKILIKYAKRLRGITAYPNGARGGQPITRVDVEKALNRKGQVYVESFDTCSLSGSGTCGD